MTIVMTTSAAGPGGSLSAGQVYTLPDAIARPLVEVFAAEPLDAVQREVERRLKLAKAQAQDNG